MDGQSGAERLNEREMRFVSERMAKGDGRVRVRVSLRGSLTSDGFTARMRQAGSPMSFASEIPRRAGCGNRAIIFLREAQGAPCVTMLPGGKAIGCRLSRGERRRKPSPSRQLLNIPNPLVMLEKTRVYLMPFQPFALWILALSDTR